MSDLQTLDFAQTQRILLLIDLHPLTTLSSPSSYLSAIISAADALLSFPPLASSLSAFRFFFSSLSPLLSSSRLRSLLPHSLSQHSSFDLAPQTLISLSYTLNSLYTDEILGLLGLLRSKVIPPRAGFTAGSICQVMHECTWEERIEDDLLGKSNNSTNLTNLDLVIRPNLVIVFSPISRDFGELREFVENAEGAECDAICERFAQVFNSAKEGLVGRDVHCSWIDVNCGEAEREAEEECLGVFEKGVRSLGWGFCSTDRIVLGSGIVPFGMIYPMIGCEMRGFSGRGNGRAELSLGIKDVSGRPLECNCCELELVGLRRMKRGGCEDISGIWDSRYLGVSDCSQEEWGNQCAKISVKEVWKDVKNLKLKDSFRDYLLLHGSSREHKRDRKGSSSGGFFADRVLQTLCMEASEFTPGKPLWPLFLNFLYKNNYWAVVSVSFGDEDSLFGILKPFTIHSAIVCMLDRSISCNYHDLDELYSSLVETVTANNSEVPTVKFDDNQANPSSVSQPESLKKKNHKKHLRLLQNLSWSSFREAVHKKTRMDLEEIYFSSDSNNSKKMKFLRCWMKQTQKSSRCFQIRPVELETTTVIEEKLIERVDESEKENEHPVSSSFSTEEPSSTEPSLIIGEAIQLSCSETLEGFFNSISTKIQQGLEFKEVDLCALAERLVESSIYWLCLKHGKESTATDTTHEEPVKDCVSTIASELVKLLLREPKDLAVKYKGCDPPSSASESCHVLYNSENKVREYELQIFFRMEILRSKVKGIEEISTKKMVKQICLLLDDIQYHLDGGCFGDVSLEKYIERTIKTRYSHCLQDVVDKIYTKMDLLLCYDDDDAPSSSQMNSEDGGEAQRQKTVDNEIGESGSASASASTSSSMRFRFKENDSCSPPKSKSKDHQSNLTEAQERRERASRFLSFTRGVQHLQRVWAPKQPKAINVKTDSLPKHPKRKTRRGTRDVVCETPVSVKKRSCLRENYGNEEQTGHNVKSSKSVSKALFQDDFDA